MKELNPQERHALKLAESWANAGEVQSAFIVVEALFKKHTSSSSLLLIFTELLTEISPLEAHHFFIDLFAGENKYQALLMGLNTNDKAVLLEKHGLLSLALKDEVMALDTLQEAASLGRESLLLLGTLSYLYALKKECSLCLKCFHKALELYKEPSLFEEKTHFLEKNSPLNSIDESLFINIALHLVPLLTPKEAYKTLQGLKSHFPDRDWHTDFQDIVAQESLKQPIGLTGDHYASSDKKNW